MTRFLGFEGSRRLCSGTTLPWQGGPHGMRETSSGESTFNCSLKTSPLKLPKEPKAHTQK